MSEPAPRKRFQIHLLTAIVMMFVAGTFIWANVNGRRADVRGTPFFRSSNNYEFPRDPEITESEFVASQKYYSWAGDRLIERGWPFDAMQRGTFVYMRRDGNNILPPEHTPNVWRT